MDEDSCHSSLGEDYGRSKKVEDYVKESLMSVSIQGY